MSAELTFEEQQHIDFLIEEMRRRPSNANKVRYELFAYIDEIIEGRLNGGDRG